MPDLGDLRTISTSEFSSLDLISAEHIFKMFKTNSGLDKFFLYKIWKSFSLFIISHNYILDWHLNRPHHQPIIMNHKIDCIYFSLFHSFISGAANVFVFKEGKNVTEYIINVKIDIFDLILYYKYKSSVHTISFICFLKQILKKEGSDLKL